MKLKITSGGLEAISEGDVVEVLDHEGRQAFRSLSFFTITSYDLETILTKPFHQLFKRGQLVDEAMIGYFLKSLHAKEDKIIPIETASMHKVTEIQSPTPMQGINQDLFCGPIYSMGEQTPSAVLHVFKAFEIRPYFKLNTVDL
jgi:hypothetical protein